MEHTLNQYKIGPANIDLYYLDVPPKVEPASVSTYRHFSSEPADLKCYVKESGEIKDSSHSSISNIIFKDDNGLLVEKDQEHTVFHFAVDNISYVESIDYNTISHICYIYVNKCFYFSNTRQLHLLETTQMQIALMLYLYSINGFLMHTSAISNGNGQAMCFTGHSGAGKSTRSALFAERNYDILTDETAVVWIQEGNVYVSGTPWKGSETDYYRNDICKMEALYIIEHGKSNKLVALNVLDAINPILRQTFPHFWDKSCLYQLVNIVSKVLQIVPHYSYYFLPDSSAVEYIIQK